MSDWDDAIGLCTDSGQHHASRRISMISTSAAPAVHATDNEDDGGRLLSCERKAVSHELCSVSDEHLHELRRGELEETRLGLGGAGAGKHRLACRWEGGNEQRPGNEKKKSAHAPATLSPNHHTPSSSCARAHAHDAPVPGGPQSSTPFGGLIPIALNSSLCVMGRSTASTSS